MRSIFGNQSKEQMGNAKMAGAKGLMMSDVVSLEVECMDCGNSRRLMGSGLRARQREGETLSDFARRLRCVRCSSHEDYDPNISVSAVLNAKTVSFHPRKQSCVPKPRMMPESG